MFCSVLFLFQRIESIPPVDITLLMVELKYDEKQGIKICEIQPICHSSFGGCDYVYQKEGIIGKSLCQYLSQFGKIFLFMDPDVSSKPIREQFFKNGWKSFQRSPVPKLGLSRLNSSCNSNDISDYAAVVYAKIRCAAEIDHLDAQFPGSVLVDKAFVPYMYDKYEQSKLFSGHSILKQVKSRWGIFCKRYHPNLANEIMTKIGGEIFVIKPRFANRGNGVIIVKKDHLDKTLKWILNPDEKLKNHPDRGYHYWARDRSSSFLVEAFIETEPMMVPELGNCLFDPTFRFAIALLYQHNVLYLHFLGSYCNLGDEPINGKGSLNAKHKTSLLLPQTIKTPRLIEENIKSCLAVPLLILYKQMLGFDIDSLDLGLESSIVTASDLQELVSLMD